MLKYGNAETALLGDGAGQIMREQVESLSMSSSNLGVWRESGRSINNVAPGHRQMTWRLARHVLFEGGEAQHCG